MGTTYTHGPIRIKQPETECNQNTILFVLFTLLISPLQTQRPSKDCEFVSKMKKSLNWKFYGETISKLISRWSITHNKSFVKHLFPNKMKVNLDVLCSTMKDWIDSHIVGTNVVTVEARNRAGGNVEFSKKRANPTQFRSTICNSPVLRLSNGTRYNLLLCTRP